MTKNKKILLCIAAAILLLGASVNAQQWTAYDTSLTAAYLSTADTDGWTITGNIPGNLITNCGTATILGGYMAFSGSTVLTRNYNGLPPHSRVRI